MNISTVKCGLSALLGLALAALLVACGQSPGGSSTGAEKGDAQVTFDGARHACLVALSSEGQASEVPCAEVAQFLKDELRLMPGALCVLHASSNFDAAELDKVKANLSSAGYKLSGP